MLADELEKLRQLHSQGELSDEEYEAAKSRLLGRSSTLTASGEQDQLFGMTPTTYAMVIHLSQYACYVIPFAGVVIPIALWLRARDTNEFIDSHGRDLMNFMISYFIYSVVSAILCLVLIGFVFLIVIAVICLICPIFGAIAASKGQTYRYPSTIKFF